MPTLPFTQGPIAAYEESLGPFNGWVTRNTFMLATRAFPPWPTIEATFAANRDEAVNDLTAWVQAHSPHDRPPLITPFLQIERPRHPAPTLTIACASNCLREASSLERPFTPSSLGLAGS